MDATNFFNMNSGHANRSRPKPASLSKRIADALRTVMRLFDDGLRDEDMIAAKAVNLQYVG